MNENEVPEDELAEIEAAAVEVNEDDLAAIEQAAASDTPDAVSASELEAAPRPARRPIPEAPDPVIGLGGVALNPEYWKSQAAAAGRNLTAGFLKQGSDEFEGTVSRLKDVLPGASYKMPLSPERPLADNDDLYRAARDNVRERLEISQEQHPITSSLANMAGDLGSDALLQLAGVPVASSAYQALAGAASGLLGSDAELSSSKATPRSGASAAASTALGAGLGYALPKVGGQVAKALPGISAQVRQYLEDKAIAQGRRVLLNGADSLAGNKELRASSVREALESGAISPFGTTQSAYAALEELAEKRGGAYGAILERLQALGVKGPKVDDLADDLAQRAADARMNSGSDKGVANLFQAEADNARDVAPRDFALLGESPMAAQPSRTIGADAPPVAGQRPKDPVTGRYLPRSAEPAPPLTPDEPLYIPPTWTAPEALTPTPYAAPVQGPQQPNLTLERAERIKRDLQDKARWERLRETGMDVAKQEASQVYRGGIEKAIADAGSNAPPGSEVAQLAEEFMPTKQQLASTIDARDAAERGAAAAAKRRGVSMTDYLSGVAGAMTGTPYAAVAAAAGNNVLRNRGTSAFASGAYSASKAAGELGRWAATEPETARTLAEVGGGLMSRQVTGSDWLQKLMGSNPEALGEYGPVLASSMERGPEAFAAADYVLSQKDPAYRQKKEAAQKAASGKQ